MENALTLKRADEFSSKINLHLSVVLRREMGCIFEKLLRRFSEMSNETVSEHYEESYQIKSILFTVPRHNVK